MKTLLALFLCTGLAYADPPKKAVLAIDITPSEKECPAAQLLGYRVLEKENGYRVVLILKCGYKA